MYIAQPGGAATKDAIYLPWCIAHLCPTHVDWQRHKVWQTSLIRCGARTQQYFSVAHHCILIAIHCVSKQPTNDDTIWAEGHLTAAIGKFTMSFEINQKTRIYPQPSVMYALFHSQTRFSCFRTCRIGESTADNFSVRNVKKAKILHRLY